MDQIELLSQCHLAVDEFDDHVGAFFGGGFGFLEACAEGTDFVFDSTEFAGPIGWQTVWAKSPPFWHLVRIHLLPFPPWSAMYARAWHGEHQSLLSLGAVSVQMPLSQL